MNMQNKTLTGLALLLLLVVSGCTQAQANTALPDSLYIAGVSYVARAGGESSIDLEIKTNNTVEPIQLTAQGLTNIETITSSQTVNPDSSGTATASLKLKAANASGQPFKVLLTVQQGNKIVQQALLGTIN